MTTTFDCPPLPYSYDALEPVLSEKIVTLHYDKRTRGYYDKTNELVKGTLFEETKNISDLLTKSAFVKSDGKLFNQAAQAFNHTFFWDNLCAPNTSTLDDQQLTDQIDQDFKTFNHFKSSFIDKAVAHFGSGWAWLVYQHGKLSIKTTPNAGNPLREQDATPLMVIDVWEHSFELDYPADKQTYVTKCFDIIDWSVVSKRFKDAQK